MKKYEKPFLTSEILATMDVMTASGEVLEDPVERQENRTSSFFNLV